MPVTLDDVATLIKSGETDKAAKHLEGLSPASDADRARALVLRAQVEQQRGLVEQAIAHFEEALTLDPENRECAFHLAYLHDLRGNDDRAIELYELCTKTSPAPVNALLNLAILYEDHGRYEEAYYCIQSVLEAYPEHPRAHLFLKDLQATMTMVQEDGDGRRRHDRDPLAEIPISEFELSVRSRNCLRQMNIHTLGDLLRIGEAELLAFKNFGETSLNEIKALLASRGLSIGQSAPATPPAEQVVAEGIQNDPAVLSQPVSVLELSVRSRRCLQRLRIDTIGDLLQHSEAELLATKNFGQTSLDEIRRELTQRGLKLKPR